MSSRTPVSSSTTSTDMVAGEGDVASGSLCSCMTLHAAARPPPSVGLERPRSRQRYQAAHARACARTGARAHEWHTRSYGRDLRAHGVQRRVAAAHDRVPEIEPLETAIQRAAAETQHAGGRLL